MSNCKSGDLAMVVRSKGNACCKALIGRCIITCHIPVFTQSGLCWTPKDGPVPCPLSTNGCVFDGINDYDLMPIKGDAGPAPGDVLREPDVKRDVAPEKHKAGLNPYWDVSKWL
jgi:hypothetical protein